VKRRRRRRWRPAVYSGGTGSGKAWTFPYGSAWAKLPASGYLRAVPVPAEAAVGVMLAALGDGDEGDLHEALAYLEEGI
jgi:hypothetical protein